MRVMMDIDGVWADFVLDFTRTARALFPNCIPHSFGVRGAVNWGFKECLTQEQIDGVWSHIRRSNFFWRDVTPLFNEADRESIRRIATKHDLCWVTSRSGVDALGQTKAWLRDHGLPNWENAVLSGESKGDFVKAHGFFDVALDDAPTQIERMRAVGQEVVVMDLLYNRHLGGERVSSICEFERLVNC